MPAEYVAAVAFASTLLGLLTTSLGNLNALRHVFTHFRRHSEDLQRQIDLYGAELLKWDTMWNFNNYSDDIYRFLWHESCRSIKNARAALERDIQTVVEHLERVLNISRHDPAWRTYFALNRKPILRRFVFALFSRNSLTNEITQLKTNIETLQTLSKQRLESISGPRLIANTIDPPAATRSGVLRHLGLQLFSQLRSLPGTSQWGLELRPPEESYDAAKWKDAGALRVWFTFFDHNPQDPKWRRIVLQYSFHGDHSDDWSDGVVNIDKGQNFNPTTSKDRPHARMTRPFRALFKDQFFRTTQANDTTYQQWKKDQASLVFSLANWAFLLFHSDWTTNLCCSGIRFVEVEQEPRRLHSLTIQPDHEHQPLQVQQAGNQECHHTNQKLKNLALALAEAVCAIPFRQKLNSTNLYEKWDAGAAGALEWIEINEPELTDLVKRKSSDGVSEAVDFCLTARDPGSHSDSIASFYHDYIEKVFTPIKTWCEGQVKNESKHIQPIRRYLFPATATRWPDQAFEVPVVA